MFGIHRSRPTNPGRASAASPTATGGSASKRINPARNTSPRGKVPALRQHAFDGFAAIRPLSQRRNRRARQRPAVAFGILQHDRERNLGRREKIDRLDELPLRIKRARMRRASSRTDRRPCSVRRAGRSAPAARRRHGRCRPISACGGSTRCAAVYGRRIRRRRGRTR